MAQKQVARAGQKLTAGVEPQVYSPLEMKTYLDRFVIAQESAKQALCVRFSRQCSRRDGANVSKGNLLLYGPTGTGKTLMVNTLAKYCGINVINTSASGKSATGYVGQNFLSVFENLSKKDEYSVVFIDEFDKISMGEWLGFQQEIQNEMISILQQGRSFKVNTDNMLFVAAGAFVGLEDVVARRLGERVGFRRKSIPSDVSSLLCSATPADLIGYGIKPELVGRFSEIVPVLPLSRSEFLQIVLAEGSVFSYRLSYLRSKNVDVSVESGVHDLLVDFVEKSATGARAIETACEKLFREAEFSRPKSFVVTPDYARTVLGL